MARWERLIFGCNAVARSIGEGAFQMPAAPTAADVRRWLEEDSPGRDFSHIGLLSSEEAMRALLEHWDLDALLAWIEIGRRDEAALNKEAP